ncbi:MAG: hypothetical protein IJZ53_06530 [Tyzzerella sp.]|nr:hypothetical protein [Tyzzerella sp.]
MSVKYLQKQQNEQSSAEMHMEIMTLLTIWGVLYGIRNRLIDAGGFTYEDREYKYVQNHSGMYFINERNVTEEQFFRVKVRVEDALVRRGIAIKNTDSSNSL